uniref:peptidylprolyl isomerase n=1 Tax=Anolis carolinensis TaxID=28377 RepID=A0A803SZH5_ANOCA
CSVSGQRIKNPKMLTCPRSSTIYVLCMHYLGKLEDRTEFDNSLAHNQPFVFSLEMGQGEGEGEKGELVIPSELGYGNRAAPTKVPGRAMLIFEVELLKIEQQQEL